MNWTMVLIGAALLASIFLLKKRGHISSEEARAQLRAGAVVIDVRTPAEFNAVHLAHAKNIPLGQIESEASRFLKDKNQVLLLHCQSGMRSAQAKNLLSGMGYTQVFNLGSYGRAAEIVADK